MMTSEQGKVVRFPLERRFEFERSPQQLLGPRIHLLGAMRATSCRGENILPRRKDAQALLAYLCLAAGREIPRASLTSLLWSDGPLAINHDRVGPLLQELTDAWHDRAPGVLSLGRDCVSLDTGACSIDVLAVLGQASLAEGSIDLIAACSGVLLDGLEDISAPFTRWLSQQRMRLRERLRVKLEAELIQMGDALVEPIRVVAIARGLVAVDPAHERASRILMRALTQTGCYADALREYARCRDALRQTRDAKPSHETVALRDEIDLLTTLDDDARRAIILSTGRPPLKQRRTAPPSRRLRLSVLPFFISDTADREELLQLLHVRVAEALSRSRWLDVVAPPGTAPAPPSMFARAPVDPHGELDYVIDGSITFDGSSYQINVRLLDMAEYARPIWCSRLALGPRNLNRNTDVISRIAARVNSTVLLNEAQARRPKHQGTNPLLLLAIPLLFSMERDKFVEAGQLIDRALAIDPDNGLATAWSAQWHLYLDGQSWAENTSFARLASQELGLHATELDPDNAEVLALYAHVCSFFRRDFDMALQLFDRSLRLNPYLGLTWALSAATCCYTGKPEAALNRLDHYRSLTPFDPYFRFFESFYTIACTFAGDYSRAAVVGRRAVEVRPGFTNGYKPLIAALGHLGRREEARHYLDSLLALQPGFSIRQFAETYPFRHTGDRDRYITGLRLAGTPER